MQPHRGTLVLVFGILSLVICAPLGIAAWIMGRSDLKKMDAGLVDPQGRGLSMAGMICGIIATALFALGLIITLIWFALAVLLVGLGAASGPGSP